MGIRAIAEADLATTLEDAAEGFGWPITVTDPSETSEVLNGQSNDIAAEIDPETGQLVSGRVASVALRISSLAAVGLGIPEGISDQTKKPWIIKFQDINGNDHTFKVQQSNPDRALGIVTCLLETYQEA
jgi:hypothetical protein